MPLYEFLAYADPEQEFTIIESDVVLNTGNTIYLDSVMDLSRYAVANVVSADDVIIVAVDHI